MQSWSIIVLCYNEEASIKKSVLDVFSALKSMPISEFEIIVIDDGSSDDSVKIIRKLSNEITNVSAHFHSSNLGIGEALHTGYDAAKLENVMMVPGDGQFDMSLLQKYPQISGNQVLCFFRENVEVYSLLRRTLSTGNRLFNKLILRLNVRDINWVKAYKRVELKKLDLELRSSLVESEICAKFKILGFEFLEVPSQYLPRVQGISKGNSKSIVTKAVGDMWHLFGSISRFRRASKFTKSPV